jgi:AAA ATPase-like protein
MASRRLESGISRAPITGLSLRHGRTQGVGFPGRAREREALDGLLDRVRGGESAVLVIRGDAGIGKTALMRYCARQAAGCRLAQIVGVESEMELPFAALHQLCGPMPGHAPVMPRTAINTRGSRVRIPGRAFAQRGRVDMSPQSWGLICLPLLSGFRRRGRVAPSSPAVPRRSRGAASRTGGRSTTRTAGSAGRSGR